MFLEPDIWKYGRGCCVEGGSAKELQDLIRYGNLDTIRHHLESVIPSMRLAGKTELCAHSGKYCGRAPCLKRIYYLAEDAVTMSRLEVFEYLWDKFLRSNHAQLSWRILEWAATHGAIDFAKSFHKRQPGCFSILSPERIRGPSEGASQILYAVGSNCFEYADYMLAHGADINAGGPHWKIVPTIVSWRASEEDASRRIQYLADRGASIKETTALVRAVVKCNEFVEPLLLHGACPNEVVKEAWPTEIPGQAPLVEAAAKGDLHTVNLLISNGADTNIVNGSGISALEAAERNGKEDVVQYLLSDYLRFVIWVSRSAKRPITR